MIVAVKQRIARYWPRLRLRTIIFGTLLLVAALPGFGAIFLRVYENALVRRTEAELVAQGAAISASAALLWPRATAAAPLPQALATDRSWRARSSYDLPPTEVDLSIAPILSERPRARITRTPVDAVAQGVANRLVPVIAETQGATLAAIRLTDRRGILLNGEARGRSLAGVPELAQALAGESATVLRENSRNHYATPLTWISRASNLRLHHARPIRVDGRVVGAVLVSRTPPPLLRGMTEDAGKIALGVALILAILVLLTAVLARAIVRPIETLSRATRSVAAGRATIPGDPSLKVVEIEALYADFRGMAEAIAARSRYLRDFAASLTHEFKTPLTGISGGIELLEDHGAAMSEGERARFLANMRGDATRLNRLLGRLMDLARADMRIADARARCAPAAVIAQRIAGLDRSGFGISVAVDPALVVAMDAETLGTIATILIDNAEQAGAARLTITATVDDARLAILFADDGPGVPAADRSRIFDTFFTSKRAHGGTGLGLAIARSLAEAEGGALTLDTPMPGMAGATFRLTALRGER